MEHPYLFFVKIFEMIGLGHFAHENPHVVYSWVVMALLIGIGYLSAKSVKLVPTKAQNFFELAISGMEEFMVDITGEEGRAFFPYIGTCFLFILFCYLAFRPELAGEMAGDQVPATPAAPAALKYRSATVRIPQAVPKSASMVSTICLLQPYGLSGARGCSSSIGTRSGLP